VKNNGSRFGNKQAKKMKIGFRPTIAWGVDWMTKDKIFSAFVGLWTFILRDFVSGKYYKFIVRNLLEIY